MIDIIIVNWNAGRQLVNAVSSIALNHQSLISCVIIVDNTSTDNSLAHVEALSDLPFKLQIVRNEVNRGFGAACNQGAALVKSQYLLFLNPDTLLFANSVKGALDFMQHPANAKVGIVGIQLLDENNHIARSCARFPTFLTIIAQVIGLNRLPGFTHNNTHMVDWDHNKTVAVDHVIGAFYMIRRHIFESLGGFDERFFVYLEDLDLSLRTHKLGWRSVFLANVQAFHAGGGTSRQVKAHRLFYSMRSRLLYGFKHFTSTQAWFILILSLGLEPISRVVYALMRGEKGDVINTLKAYYMLFADLRETLKKTAMT